MLRLLSAISVVFAVCAAGFAEDAVWPRFRGPRGDGHSAEKNLPVKWSGESVAWQAPLKGRGHSSPVVWGQRLFLTGSIDDGRQRVVTCINREDGQIMWERTAWTGRPERTHKMTSWAAATPATDGKHVFAFFGHGGGLLCYTVDGTLAWKKDLGSFTGPWGTAASPVLVGDLVVQNCDADEDSYIIALHKDSGKQAWKTPRPDVRGWSTPILIEANGRKELVVNGDKGVQAYDPATGKELWFCKSFIGRGSPSVTPGENGLLHVVNGKPGPVYAIKPGGSGDVTESRRVWHTGRRSGRDLPSPILIGKYLLVMNMQGILTCYDSAAEGKQLWKTRIGGNYSASPVAHSGLAFFIGESGETTVVKPGLKPVVVSRNRVDPGEGEIFRACITPFDGRMYIRSDRKLYCVK